MGWIMSAATDLMMLSVMAAGARRTGHLRFNPDRVQNKMMRSLVVAFFAFGDAIIDTVRDIVQGITAK
ncbi:Fungal protein of unknown function (DUF1748) [Plasmodiophora brassicae]|nr:hypothetical protein PBRA_001364 [Plasmodiophora brassicae]